MSNNGEKYNDCLKIIAQCYKDKVKPPEWVTEHISSRPVLGIGLSFYLDAFWNLNTERQQGDNISSIPWSKVQQYSEYYNLDFEESEKFHYIIRHVDDAFIKKVNENAKKQLESIKSGNSAKK